MPFKGMSGFKGTMIDSSNSSAMGIATMSVGGTWKARNAFGFTMSIAGVPERWKRDLSSSGSGLFTRYAKLEWQDGVLVRLI